MSKPWSMMAAFGLLLAAVNEGRAAEPTAQQIVEASTEATRLDGSEMVSTLTIYNAKRQKRVRTIAAVAKLFDEGATEKRLLRFLTPADIKGTGFLTFDYETKSDDMWLFMPALRKIRRIVASDKAKSFMGSEFSYADITPPAVADFTYTKGASESVAGVDCWVVTSVPKSEDIAEENGYSKRITWIGKADHVIRKAEYYDLGGELAKVLTAGGVKEVDPNKHKYRAMHMAMENRQNGRSSELKVNKIQLRLDIPDSYFTTRYLERQ